MKNTYFWEQLNNEELELIIEAVEYKIETSNNEEKVEKLKEVLNLMKDGDRNPI